MEPKKIKKLTLNKETIANLTNLEMGHHKGGSIFFCDTGLQWDCVWSLVVMGACSAGTGCVDCLTGVYCFETKQNSIDKCPTVDYWTCGGNCA